MVGQSELISLKNVSRTYKTPEGAVFALDNISLSIAREEFVAIIGHSGSGKTTLMNILGCLDTATSGSYFLNGAEVTTLNQRTIAQIRNREIGFIFQSFNLVPELTALENVELPLIFRGIARNARKEIAMQAINLVGLLSRATHRPSELSGGQQQRVAIARAIASKPPLILADEPTGNLDRASGKIVMELLQSLHESGHTVVIITHDEAIAKIPKRKIEIESGKISH